MPYAILRTAKLKSMGEIGGSLGHTFRTRDTPNADPGRTPNNEHLGPASVDDVRAGIVSRLPQKVRKNGVLCIEYFIGGSPEAFKNNTGGDQYFRAAMDWLKERHGAENVISGHVHRDETTPHLVAYVVPRDGDKLNARKWLGGRAALSAMQTDFAENVGRPFGLERGIEGSKAHHTTIQAHYAAISRDSKPILVEIPAPTLAERLSPKEYGERVAESVLHQTNPRQQALAARANTAESERKRRKEIEATVKAQAAQLDKAKPVMELFAGLKPEQVAEVAKLANEHQSRNRIEVEAQRRVDQLASLAKRSVGAVQTFVRRALDAIKAKAGEWRRVDWPEVENKTFNEAVHEHGQSRLSAVQAVMEHSPGQAGAKPKQVAAMLERAAKDDLAAGLKPEPPKRDRGPSMGR